MNLNRVVLTGNLTRDPELRSTPSGTSVCQFSIAVNGREKRGGEWQDRADFFDCVAWGSMGESLARYKQKGDPLAVDGRLRQERWQTQGGDNRSRVVVVADSVQFLGSRQQDGQAAAGAPAAAVAQPTPASGYTQGGTPSPGALAGHPLADDDIPF